jgi:hypothetical protein
MAEMHSDPEHAYRNPSNSFCRQKRLYTEKEALLNAQGIPLSLINRKHPSYNLTQHRQALQHRRLRLKRRPGRLLANAAGQDVVGALLHAHLALHLLHLLLLAERQRPGDAEQQRAGADDPESFAAEAEA